MRVKLSITIATIVTLVILLSFSLTQRSRANTHSLGDKASNSLAQNEASGHQNQKLTAGSDNIPQQNTDAAGSFSSDAFSLNKSDVKSSVDSLSLPIRAAFYYPWFPEGWTQGGVYPYSNYTPTLGYYDLSDQEIILQQINAMLYGHIEAGILSWWGQGTNTDNHIPTILAATGGTPFKWAIYYEPEGVGDPDVAALTAALVYLQNEYSNDPAYLRINNRFVIFVYAGPADGCGMVDRWKQANTVNAYIVLKVFPGYQACPNQPDGWHQYAPAVAADSQGQYSYTISPGFWKVGEAPRLVRNLTVWQENIRAMMASGAAFQLITTFNEWGEGTAVESADAWATPSGFGAYLDALHNTGMTDSIFLPLVERSGTDPVVVGAGDIADCGLQGDEKTAALLDNIQGTVITFGDNVYESGTVSEFNNCYNPTWGRQKNRTRPSPGNHDYGTTAAAGYFGYFGSAAGAPGKGYYSYNLGAWHVIELNSNCSQVGGCGANSPQWTWLQADLAAHPTLCTLAYWHTPLFSSGYHGGTSAVKSLWQLLYQAGVELVLNGHDHNYERFAPQNPDGVADPLNGIREFVVGTGGKDLRTMGAPSSNSVIRNDTTWGVIKLTLHSSSYEWKFIPVAGKTFTDSGSGTCH